MHCEQQGLYPKISVQSNHPFKRMPPLFSFYWVQIIQINLSVGTLGGVLGRCDCKEILLESYGS